MELIKNEHFSLRIYVEDEFINNYTSNESRKAYKQVLEEFVNFIEGFTRVKNYDDITKHMVVQYRDYIMESRGRHGDEMAPTTVNKHLSIISAFFDYLISKDLIEKNPVNTVKRPRYEVKKHSTALTKEQLEELLASIKSKESGPLHLALIATLWLTGMRKSEVLNLKYKDYYKDNGNWIFQYKGKGGKYRRKLVHDRLKQIIDDYLSWMAKNNRQHEKEDWLFQPTKNPHSPKDISKPINPRTLNRIIEKYSKKIGLDFNVSSHSARATFITLLLEQKAPIVDIAKEVAHSNVSTTQGYDRRKDNVDNSLVKIFPVKKKD